MHNAVMRGEISTVELLLASETQEEKLQLDAIDND